MHLVPLDFTMVISDFFFMAMFDYTIFIYGLVLLSYAYVRFDYDSVNYALIINLILFIQFDILNCAIETLVNIESHSRTCHSTFVFSLDFVFSNCQGILIYHYEFEMICLEVHRPY